MNTVARAVVKQVDHIAIRVADPHYLFSLLANTFELPVAWPIAPYGLVLSGGVCAGNTNLETVRFGPSRSSSTPAASRARLYGIAFEPFALRESLRELARREIPHGPPIPYGGKHGKLYTTVVLGKLASEDARGVLYLGPQLGGDSWVNIAVGKCLGKIINRRLVAPLVLKSVAESMVYLVEYTHDVDQVQAMLRAQLEARQGGALGLEAVQEIVVEVTDLSRAQRHWQRLLAPTAPTAPGKVAAGQWPSDPARSP